MLNTLPASMSRHLLVVLSLLMSACGASLPVSPPGPVQRAQIPPLPASARQPLPPSQCLPDCSNSAASDAQSSRDMLTRLASPAKPASAPTTP